jgi:hypothetical protein
MHVMLEWRCEQRLPLLLERLDVAQLTVQQLFEAHRVEVRLVGQHTAARVDQEQRIALA